MFIQALKEAGVFAALLLSPVVLYCACYLLRKAVRR